MITHNFNTLDLLTSPVWIVSPFEEQLIYANSAARLLMQDLTFSQLRTPLDTALSLAETIRVSVAKVSISGLPRFTVSIGVAHHEGNESIDELFKRVDDALYRAKNDGRNRVLAA